MAIAADCKSVTSRYRWFESSHSHDKENNIISGSSSVGRASAFQAEGREFESRLPLNYDAKRIGRCSSGVERFLGKEEVTSSILVIGSAGIHSFDLWVKFCISKKKVY